MTLHPTPLGWTGTCPACTCDLATAEGVKLHNLHASAGERTYPTASGPRVALVVLERRAA